MTTYTAEQVAHEIRRRVPGVSVVKLHKLLYYCQGRHLAVTGEPLFADRISAWDTGPVAGNLWYSEKRSGEQPSDGIRGDEAALHTIGEVVARYGMLSAAELIRLTHGERPWSEADAQRRPGGSVPIATERIRDWFRQVRLEEETDPEVDRAQLEALMAGAEERAKLPAVPDDRERLLDLYRSL